MTRAMSTSDDDCRQQKQALRKEIRAQVKALSREDVIKQSNKVWERLCALPAYQKAKSVGLFLSMPKHEINTDTVLKDAIQQKKTVYVPEVGQNFEKVEMELIRVILDDDAEESLEIFHHEWPKNKWRIPEPPADMPRIFAKTGDIDLMVVPGLCFDRNGGRLGQGKGYYDRFLARIRSDSTPKLVAVGLAPSLVDEIPMTEHDFRMEIILLPDETIVVD